MISAIARRLRMLPRRLQRFWLMVVPLAAVGAALEAAGAGAIFALISVMQDPAGAADLPLVGGLLARLPEDDPRARVLWTTVAVAVLHLTRTLTLIFVAWYRTKLTAATRAQLSPAALGTYLRAPYVFQLRHNSAELIENALGGVASIANHVVGSAFFIISEAVVLLGLLFVLAVAAPLATAVSTAVLGGVVYLILGLTRSRAIELGVELRRHDAASYRMLKQGLQAAKELRLLGRTGAVREGCSCWVCCWWWGSR
jgi:ATP-binding cassette subfamily C protein